MASNSFPVAVIGMAIKLPGAESCDEYWKLIMEGQDTVGEFPSEREADISHVLPSFQSHLLDEGKPFFTGSFFKSVDGFDADLFQINPKEAMFIEPQQRFFLETAWKLMEDAGYASSIRGSKTGVYVGNTVNKYKLVLTENHPSISHGNHSPFVSARVSYTLDLSGPAMMVATGCSSSLLAVHLACQGLLSGDCDMAIAGGITIDLLPVSTKTDIWNQLGITGPNVKCRAFDACAKGIAKGEGCGAVLLKPLEKALSDGDHVYGILQATTANQDGHSNGITAPHPVAQANLLHIAWELADICPDKLGYFEAHGTGTELGDPIEISGITKAFKMSGVNFGSETNSGKIPKIPIGSVKANIGHLADGAAGVVALIKTLLCMNHDKIPPAANFLKPNPHINWQKAPVYVNTSPLDWKPNADKSPRFASVSAFGLLGTNVHAVVKEHVLCESATIDYAMANSKHCTILVLAAASKKSLLAFVRRMIEYFQSSDNQSLKHLQNVCFTINTGREQDKFDARAIAYGKNWDEMTQALQHLLESLDKISSNERKIRVSAGFNSEENFLCPTKKEDSCSTAIRVKEDYLKGKAIQWKKVYSGHSSISLQKVPFLPTYAFNKVRYWPKKGKPINEDLLRLEQHPAQSDEDEETNGHYDAGTSHQNSKHASNHSLALPGVNVTLRDECQKQTSKSNQSKDADLLLSEALNEALGREYDWMLLKDENLFSLGVDSLICTHVNMRIKDALGLNAEAFTMTDFHMNSSYGRLLKVIQAKIRPSSSESNFDTRSSFPKLTTSIKGLYPLSFAQKRLWVMQEIVTNPCAYNATNSLYITGQFHPSAFVLSANTVLSRHGAFFTVFANTPNGLFQTHNWNQLVKVVELDYRSSGDISEDRAMKQYEGDYKTPFDLEQGPLVRCKLYYLSKDKYLFTMVVHHIIFDGWSHFNFYNELWHTYRNACDGVVEQKPIHKPLYVELVSEEQKEVTSGSSRIVTDLAYWKQKLCGPLPLTTLPGDKRRPPVFSYNGGRITRFIGNDVLSTLVQLTGDEYTMFMALIATVFSLLHQYTGENDLIIGTPVAGRYDTKTKDVIGCFVNTLVLRLQLKGDMSFNEILESVSKVCLDAYDHQHAPFDLLVSELSLPRDTSITPIFSVNVCYHNTEVKAEHVPPPSELHIERKLLHNNSSKWDMQFDFLHEQEGMRFTLEYYSDVYSTDYAVCVADNFVSLISRVVREPSAPISRVKPVSEVSNGLTPDMCVLHGTTRNIGNKALPNLLIESLCHFAEESFIIDINGKGIAYREVLKKAGEIAVFLRQKCEIQSQSRIGLLLNNSFESLASILACILSGLVYVPLNCDDPKHRLGHICNESQLKAIIFSKSNISLANNLLWACQSVRVLFCVDEKNFEELLESPQEAPLMNKELWDHTAYNGEDDIEAGGWKSSYTGDNLSEMEMDEYAENILKKLKQYIKPDSRILEIGCASGITTKKLYPFAGHYVATDISQAMTERLSNALKGSKTVEVHCAPAHQVGHVFQGQVFDVIILNSVVHCFPGHNYLRKVLDSCDSLLQENGIIFVGDIMDLEKKDKLVWKLKSFKASYPWYRTKTEWHSELFLSREYLQHLCDTSQTLRSVCFSSKIFTVSNELTEFRYDAIFSKSSICPEISLKKSKVRDVTTCANSDLADALNDKQDPDILATLTKWSRKIDFADEAYVLYTSGTTGTPKGVIIGHEALLNYVQWASSAYKLDKGSTLPLFSPLTFDFTVTSIFPPLLNGSTIRIFKSFQDSYQDLALCPELTTVKFSPLQLDTVLSVTDRPLSASIFIVGGEELTSELLHKLKQNKESEKFEVWNEYGPTEATVGCVAKCFCSDDLPLDKSEYVTIGKPIDNVTIALTRNRFSHVPVGGKGKLCIGGKCLCLDFAGTGSSKETKISKSFDVACWGDPGELMFITDDIASVMPGSKEIAYYGREESSTTKVNGVRVDLMEIQHAIESHHLVQSAWVNSFTYSNYMYLGAAVKLKSTSILHSCNTETWKHVLISSLTSSLPSRCIPKVLVSISDPPTNSNGKKDTNLLQGLFEAELQSGLEISDGNTSDMGGISATDASKLQVLWQSILPVKRLPNFDEDFFFDLSGDSLQAIHLVRKMRNEGYQVSVGDIFQNPTIRKLLKALQGNTGDHMQKQSKIKEEAQKFRPTPIIEEFLKRDHKNPDHFALSSLLRFERKLKPSVLKVALRSVMDKHSSLRSRFEIVEGVALQEVLNLQPNQPTVKEIKLSCKEDHLIDDPAFLNLCQNLEQSHSLADGILLNAAIIDVTEKEDTESTEKACTYLLLVVHHIAIDIVSWQQVLEDLATALKMLSDNEDQEHVMLQKCILPFASFCNALHEQVSGIFGEEITYWKNIEAECAESGLLMKEHRQSTFKSAKWLSHSFDAVTLRTMSTRLKCSDEHILLTILGKALSSIHGKDKTAIVLESHGRQLPNADSTSTVGWCTSMFPFVLETSRIDNIQKQVKQVEKKVKQVPHRGLGFGLLQADGKLTIPSPNIMFVFQGSLDASTKQKFDGGKHKFEHVPWIEVMHTELMQRRFHRHPEEILPFDLEVIAWVHGGQLKIGFLFDTKTICESLVENLVDHAENDLKVLAKELNCCTKFITAEIIPFFNINPDCIQTAKDSLMEHGINAEKLLVCPPEQALQSMIESLDKSSDITVMITRHTTENQAQEFKKAYKEFLEARGSNKVIIINAESLPNSVKLPVEKVQTAGNIVQLPTTLGQAFYDKRTDLEYNMPLTQEGYSQIGLIIARSIRAGINGNKYKVIAVDADYTLWDGECACGCVNMNTGNICLQKFLLKKKREGLLLVILSKNSYQDVVKVFETQRDQMILGLDDIVEIVANWNSKADNIRTVANQLNLDLKSFVFIDDNPLECEEMVTSCPEILTLQLPSNPKLVGIVLDNLWSLDNMDITKESSERSEMYRNESIRQKEMDKVKKVAAAKRQAEVTNLLAKWKMKLTFLKTNVLSIKQNKTLLKRAAELLHRTNQFKLNDVFSKFSEFQEEDACWLISLDDCHGSYGIVSVCVIDNSSLNLKQWVLSCRALGRMVETRILKEIHASFKEGLQLSVNRTERNTPTISFLETLGCSIGKTGLICSNVEDTHLLQTAETLHTIEVGADVTSFTEQIYSSAQKDIQHIDEHITSDNPFALPTLKDVNSVIHMEWSLTMKEQSRRHNLFPIIPSPKDIKQTEETGKLDDCPFSKSRTQVLQSTWMEVLKSDQTNPRSTDNFLELGGDSFSAVFLVSKLQRALNIEISVIDVLKYPKYGDFHNLILQAPISNKADECKSMDMRCTPLSAAQQRMLIMQESAPDSTAYVETVALYTSEKLCPSEIFASLVKQHPILKAKFEFSDESLFYVMSTHENLDTDTELESVENLKTASEYLTQSIPRIKVLSSPLVRFRHLEAGGLTILALHIHHAIVDETTLSNISNDLEKLIHGQTLHFQSGKELCDPIVNLQDNLSSIQQKSNEQYWAENFKILPPEISLAILPQTQALWKDTVVYRAEQSRFPIADKVVNNIIKYCQSMGITPFQYFLACALIILQRYLGVDEVTLAIPVTTRTDVSQYTDGLFVNTVLFRCPIYCSMSFESYMKTVAERWMQTLRHAQYPFDELVKILTKEHKKAPSSFCSIMFNFTSKVRPASALEVQSKHAKMPLSLDVLYNEKEGTSEVVVEWASELIDDGVAKRLADGLVNVLCETLKAPDTLLCKINALSPLEQKLVQSFSQFSEENITDSHPIQVLFEEHAALNPDATAISCNGSTVSYAQLNRMASSIACALSGKFTQAALKSRPIVIAMKKDEYTIASILGIWKAGGHFLPVASNLQSVLKQILERCKPLAVIFNILLEVNKETCPMFNIKDLVNYPSENFLTSQEVTNSDDHAYIIRTSGSTGEPKQCKISHKSLKIIAQAWTKKYQMTKFCVRVLQWAPISFDVFIGDVVRGLMSTSGQLIICPDQFRLDVFYILNLIKKHQITMAEVTPQFGLQLVENSARDDLESLTLLVLGSDVLQNHVFQKIKSVMKKEQRVINSYGMTEATIDSSFYEGPVVSKTRSGTMPIGKPLPGVTFHILDTKTRLPCPIGTIGELYISGNVLASGDVEVTQLNETCLALKTGDSACWLPTGDVDLIGRLDSVVKLRGFRISTHEIENKVAALVKGVREVYVVPMLNEVDQSHAASEFLCAFLVLENDDNEEGIDSNAIRHKLHAHLPYYMVPDIFHVIDRTPLTANGKIDFQALPSISQLLELNSVIPTTQSSFNLSATAALLKELLGEALGLPDSSIINPELTFMELGVHSLVLVRLSSLIKQKSSFDVEIADLFSYPTITDLAEYIDHGKEVNHQVTCSKEEEKTQIQNDEEIAITGIGLRLPPNITSLAEFWRILDKGEDLIQEFPEQRSKDVTDALDESSVRKIRRNGTFKGAFLERIEMFDSHFFKIAPGEAKYMSPEQRLFLQVATEALAEANGLSKSKGARIGVFVGSSEVGYTHLSHPDDAVCISGLLPGMIATRVAYQWDLKGPTMLIDTACSSSLVALKTACESIRNGECEGALVGGVSLVLYPSRCGVFGQTSILSEDFHCRAFDCDASGTAVGEGVMCLYVEPISKAIKEGKPIYGLIKGAASNSVGHGNGITAPTAVSQQMVIQDALTAAKVLPSDISFLEAHGTGTNLGDRIELSALSAVFSGENTIAKLPIGSVKSIFGHLDSAAGMIGVFKILASFMAKKIGPNANFNTPNCELENSTMYVPSKSVAWEIKDSNGRIAGISSFGLTGTNCHVIIQECNGTTERHNSASSEASMPLLFSGRSIQHILKQISKYMIYLKDSVISTSEISLLSLCVTIARRLKDVSDAKMGHIDYRMAITETKPEKVLSIMEVANSLRNINDVVMFANLRSDVHLYGPENTQMHCQDSYLRDFLVHGTIELDGLFSCDTSQIKSAKGVSLVMYDEERHWLDACVKNTLLTQPSGLVDLLQKKIEETRELTRTLPLSPTEELNRMQGKFCAALIIKFLKVTNIAGYLSDDKEISSRDAFLLTGMHKKYEKLFFVMIRELCRNHLVRATGCDQSIGYLDSFKFECEHVLQTDPEVIANAAIEKFPPWADCFRFPLYCSQHFEDVLVGKMSPLSVIYPQGNLNFMYQFDKLGDLLGDVYYNMYMQIIAEYAKQLSSQRNTVRVLEVGAGVGYVTRQLLPKMKDIPNIEYWFTDLGKAFVERAKSLFPEYLHMMKLATFDITKSAPKQGILGSFDIVISYNVIHTTESIIKSVANLKSCLGEEGTLFIIESARNDTWATLAWGLLDGWWYFKDYDLRSAEPMLEADKWEAVLKDIGFGSICTCPVNEDERRHVEKCLFACSNKQFEPSELVRPGWWETDAHRFNPYQEYNDPEDMGSINNDIESNKVDEQNKETAVYQELKMIWSKLLGIDNIHFDDDFNSLGGESLLAIQMMRLVCQRIGFQLEIADTFGYPTLGSLAAFIADNLPENPVAELSGPDQRCVSSSTGAAGVLASKPNTLVETKSIGVLDVASEKRLHHAREAKERRTMIMFPGQGAQKRDMCISMKNSPEARAVFSRAEQILGYNVLELFLDDDTKFEEKLKSTEFVQVSLFLSCLAKVEQLKVERPDLIDDITCIAGLSVGEFAALVYSGVMSFEDALRIVQERGRAMETEVRSTASGMVSVLGPTSEELEVYLKDNFPDMKISTYLADNQHTVAGREEDCLSLVKVLSLKENQSNIIDVRKLRVAGGFHSDYMRNAEKRITPLIQKVSFSKPSIPVIMNVNAEVVDDPQKIQTLVCQQLVSPVQWRNTVITAYKLGVRNFVEIAPARVLSSIVKNRIEQCKDCTTELIKV
ncbi:uncharacterized protein LOC116297562 [Actinia tenebrosa]|uniref:Fatty acid synthase n=1 Tax=Actinia tenebrosa TaxID=6105 RepID=A0A6P8I1L9_ACTTE|nr:uncharacterized protein LOC116297562 [Actinia tenebrosa]XP_031561673.1 uncharacterized protein LOC116297562 [Actinia tenebrosa]